MGVISFAAIVAAAVVFDFPFILSFDLNFDRDRSWKSDSEESEEEEEVEEKEGIEDQTSTNLVNLRRTIYLTIMNALNYEEAVHKLLKVQIEEGDEVTTFTIPYTS